MLFDQANSIVTMYLINHDNQMQMYWRDWIYSGNVPQHQWTQGDVIPSAAKPLGFELNPNSTLSLAQTTANSIFAQEAKTGNIWRVSWEGLGANQRWTKAVSTNATAQPNSVMHTQSMYASDLAHNLTHAFVQQNGNDITHLILQGDGTFTVRDRIPT